MESVGIEPERGNCAGEKEQRTLIRCEKNAVATVGTTEEKEEEEEYADADED